MSEDPAAASFLDRVNTLSAPAVAGLGALAGILLASLSALSVEPSSTAGEPAHAAAAATPRRATPTLAADADADADPAAEESMAAGAAADGQAVVASNGGDDSAGGAAEEPDPDAEPGVDADANADAEDTPEEEPEDLVLLEPDVGASDDGEPDAADPDAAPAPAGSPSRRTQSDRDAEAKMDADELLTAASEAYKDKRYKDAYRLATRSHRARPKDKAQMLRGRAACRLRDEKNAREIVRSFKLGDEHRKTLRTFCKDRGVRVGL